MTTDTSKQQYKSNSQSVVLNYNYASFGRAGDGMTVSTLFMLNEYCCCLRGQYSERLSLFLLGRLQLFSGMSLLAGKQR